MMLREIAESDYHYVAEQVGKWTIYQLKMYLCEKKRLTGRREFATPGEAIDFAKEMRAKYRTLEEFTGEEHGIATS